LRREKSYEAKKLIKEYPNIN